MSGSKVKHAEEVRVGCYQILTLVLLSVNFITVAMSHVISIFYKYTPRFYCQEEAGEAVASTVASMGEYVRNRTYNECPAGGCPEGRYVFEALGPGNHPGRQEWSVAMEWRLVCEREHLMKAATGIYYAGMLVGGLLAGVLADRLGRLPVLAICLYAQGIMAIALNIVQRYELFLVFRGLQGFFIQGLESCSFILCMELFPAKFRTLVALLVLSMRSCGYALLSGLSYLIPDWRILQLVITIPTAMTVLYIWILPESPRWLMAKGKRMEAEILLERIAKYNSLCGGGEETQQTKDQQSKPEKPKRKLARGEESTTGSAAATGPAIDETDNLLSASAKPESSSAATICIDESRADHLVAEKLSPSDEKDGKDEDSGNSYHLVAREALATNLNARSKSRFKWAPLGFLESKFVGCSCLVLICLWFTSSTAFHALVSQPQRLTTERHLSLAIAACMELVSFILCFCLIKSRCGRRWTLCAAQLLIGASCIAIAILTLAHPRTTGIAGWLVRAKTGIVLLGRIANISTFFILRLLVIEFFPTTSRGTGVGLCIAAEMIGGLIMPYISVLNNYILELPRFLIGLFGICAGLSTLIFPDTSYDILPDSHEDAKSLRQRDKMMYDIENANQQSKNSEVLREKLFSEDWVDAGNGISVDFTDHKDEE